MIFAHGQLLSDGELPRLLAGLEGEIAATRAGGRLETEAVIAALDRLARRLEGGEFGELLARYLPAGTSLDQLTGLLGRETLENKLRRELGEDPWAPVELPRSRAARFPLGTLLHVAAGNMPGLPVYSVIEGLLTGNVNLLKLPHGDRGLSLAALSLLVREEPELAGYVYAFELPSQRREELRALAGLADAVVTWGGDSAVTALRELAPAGCRLIEWGHRLGFAYIAGYEDRQAELTALAEHIMATGQRLCSSCQVIFLDTEDLDRVRRFCGEFVGILEAAARGRGTGAQAALAGRTALLERIVDGRTEGEEVFRGRGCSLIARPDRELELSPMEGNVLVKALPRGELAAALRRSKGRLQTAGLLCDPAEREELTGLLARAGVTRVTRAGGMSDAFPGEGHDGEYPLERYTRVVDVER